MKRTLFQSRYDFVRGPLMLLCLLSGSAGAQFVLQGPKLVGTGAVDGGNHVWQGGSVALSADGSTAIVSGGVDNDYIGAAWVYTRTAGVWSQQGPKLVGSGAVKATFGEKPVALSADGNTALMGTWSPLGGGGNGAVWVFTRSGGAWAEQAKLVGTGAASSFESDAVALSADGNTAISGSTLDGAAWVWTRSGGVWTQQGGKLVASDVGGTPGQGAAVGLSGDGNTALVGASGDSGNAGAGFVWTRSGGTWTEQAKLTGGVTGGFFSPVNMAALSSDGNTAILGGDGDNGSVGAAWVYTRSGSVWTAQGGNLVGTGAVGPPDQGVFQGFSVALSGNGNTALVGGWNDNGGVGATWVFSRTGGVWTQQGAKLTTASVFQGFSVAISTDGTTAIVGAPGDGATPLIGAAWVYVQGPTTASGFIPVTPCRIADTRNAPGPFGGPSLPGGSRQFVIPSSSCGIPPAATAYSLNATVVPHGSLGYLTMWPSGQTQPLVSTLNSPDGRIKANAAIVPAGTGGAIEVFVTDSADLVLDIDGYFVATGTMGALAFFPLSPCRISDTRNAPGPNGGPTMLGGQTRTIPTWNVCNVPTSAQALSLNYTVVPQGGLAFLTTWPTGQSQPLVSTLNAPTGTVVANAAIVPTGIGGNGGKINVFVTNTTDVVIDVNGYFAQAFVDVVEADGISAPNVSAGLSFYAATPCRILDTRNAPGAFGGPAMAGGGTRAFTVPASACSIPSSAQAYSLNATVVPGGPLGYLTLWPAGIGQPLVSTLNAQDGALTSNAAIVPAGTSGAIDVFVTNPTHLILDINGYFAP